MKQVNFYMSEEQLQKLEKVAKDTDIKKSEIFRRALDDYLNKYELRKDREMRVYGQNENK